MTSSIRVIVVDDHPLFREGVAASLQNSGLFQVVGEGGSAADAVSLVRELRPELALLDLSMPGGGIDAARHIAEHAPEVRIVVLTASESDDDILQALRAGARGYVLKGVGSSTLVEILQGISRGESYVSPALAGRILSEMHNGGRSSASAEPLPSLTGREEEILRLVSTGQSNKEIARRLELQEKTVKHHMTRIFEQASGP